MSTTNDKNSPHFILGNKYLTPQELHILENDIGEEQIPPLATSDSSKRRYMPMLGKMTLMLKIDYLNLPFDKEFQFRYSLWGEEQDKYTKQEEDHPKGNQKQQTSSSNPKHYFKKKPSQSSHTTSHQNPSSIISPSNTLESNLKITTSLQQLSKYLFDMNILCIEVVSTITTNIQRTLLQENNKPTQQKVNLNHKEYKKLIKNQTQPHTNNQSRQKRIVGYIYVPLRKYFINSSISQFNDKFIIVDLNRKKLGQIGLQIQLEMLSGNGNLMMGHKKEVRFVNNKIENEVLHEYNDQDRPGKSFEIEKLSIKQHLEQRSRESLTSQQHNPYQKKSLKSSQQNLVDYKYTKKNYFSHQELNNINQNNDDIDQQEQYQMVNGTSPQTQTHPNPNIPSHHQKQPQQLQHQQQNVSKNKPQSHQQTVQNRKYAPNFPSVELMKLKFDEVRYLSSFNNIERNLFVKEEGNLHNSNSPISSLSKHTTKTVQIKLMLKTLKPIIGQLSQSLLLNPIEFQLIVKGIKNNQNSKIQNQSSNTKKSKSSYPLENPQSITLTKIFPNINNLSTEPHSQNHTRTSLPETAILVLNYLLCLNNITNIDKDILKIQTIDTLNEFPIKEILEKKSLELRRKDNKKRYLEIKYECQCEYGNGDNVMQEKSNNMKKGKPENNQLSRQKQTKITLEKGNHHRLQKQIVQPEQNKRFTKNQMLQEKQMLEQRPKKCNPSKEFKNLFNVFQSLNQSQNQECYEKVLQLLNLKQQSNQTNHQLSLYSQLQILLSIQSQSLSTPIQYFFQNNFKLFYDCFSQYKLINEKLQICLYKLSKILSLSLNVSSQVTNVAQEMIVVDSNNKKGQDTSDLHKRQEFEEKSLMKEQQELKSPQQNDIHQHTTTNLSPLKILTRVIDYVKKYRKDLINFGLIKSSHLKDIISSKVNNQNNLHFDSLSKQAQQSSSPLIKTPLIANPGIMKCLDAFLLIFEKHQLEFIKINELQQYINGFLEIIEGTNHMDIDVNNCLINCHFGHFLKLWIEKRSNNGKFKDQQQNERISQEESVEEGGGRSVVTNRHSDGEKNEDGNLLQEQLQFINQMKIFNLFQGHLNNPHNSTNDADYDSLLSKKFSTKRSHPNTLKPSTKTQQITLYDLLFNDILSLNDLKSSIHFTSMNTNHHQSSSQQNPHTHLTSNNTHTHTHNQHLKSEATLENESVYHNNYKQKQFIKQKHNKNEEQRRLKTEEVNVNNNNEKEQGLLLNEGTNQKEFQEISYGRGANNRLKTEEEMVIDQLNNNCQTNPHKQSKQKNPSHQQLPQQEFIKVQVTKNEQFLSSIDNQRHNMEQEQNELLESSKNQSPNHNTSENINKKQIICSKKPLTQYINLICSIQQLDSRKEDSSEFSKDFVVFYVSSGKQSSKSNKSDDLREEFKLCISQKYGHEEQNQVPNVRINQENKVNSNNDPNSVISDILTLKVVNLSQKYLPSFITLNITNQIGQNQYPFETPQGEIFAILKVQIQELSSVNPVYQPQEEYQFNSQSHPNAHLPQQTHEILLMNLNRLISIESFKKQNPLIRHYRVLYEVKGTDRIVIKDHHVRSADEQNNNNSDTEERIIDFEHLEAIELFRGDKKSRSNKNNGEKEKHFLKIYAVKEYQTDGGCGEQYKTKTLLGLSSRRQKTVVNNKSRVNPNQKPQTASEIENHPPSTSNELETCELICQFQFALENAHINRLSTFGVQRQGIWLSSGKYRADLDIFRVCYKKQKSNQMNSNEYKWNQKIYKIIKVFQSTKLTEIQKQILNSQKEYQWQQYEQKQPQSHKQPHSDNSQQKQQQQKIDTIFNKISNTMEYRLTETEILKQLIFLDNQPLLSEQKQAQTQRLSSIANKCKYLLHLFKMSPQNLNFPKKSRINSHPLNPITTIKNIYEEFQTFDLQGEGFLQKIKAEVVKKCVPQLENINLDQYLLLKTAESNTKDKQRKNINSCHPEERNWQQYNPKIIKDIKMQEQHYSRHNDSMQMSDMESIVDYLHILWDLKSIIGMVSLQQQIITDDFFANSDNTIKRQLNGKNHNSRQNPASKNSSPKKYCPSTLKLKPSNLKKSALPFASSFSSYIRIYLKQFTSLQLHNNQPCTLQFRILGEKLANPIYRCYSHKFNKPQPILFEIPSSQSKENLNFNLQLEIYSKELNLQNRGSKSYNNNDDPTAKNELYTYKLIETISFGMDEFYRVSNGDVVMGRESQIEIQCNELEGKVYLGVALISKEEFYAEKMYKEESKKKNLNNLQKEFYEEQRPQYNNSKNDPHFQPKGTDSPHQSHDRNPIYDRHLQQSRKLIESRAEWQQMKNEHEKMSIYDILQNELKEQDLNEKFNIDVSDEDQNSNSSNSSNRNSDNEESDTD